MAKCLLDSHAMRSAVEIAALNFHLGVLRVLAETGAEMGERVRNSVDSCTALKVDARKFDKRIACIPT